jgi:formylglycine-generating enzyme required for sulfatase activity
VLIRQSRRKRFRLLVRDGRLSVAFIREVLPMSIASVLNGGSGSRGLPTHAGKIFCLLIAVASGTSQAQVAPPIDWVDVGDPGNAADTTGYGAVPYSFKIMKFEFRNDQYTSFLNSVATVSDPYTLYNASMGVDPRGGITQSGTAGAYTYAVKANMGDKPVNYVSWFDAARVANWLQNGASGTSSTETGAYTLNGLTTGTAPGKNPGALIYVPTEDEWYKAAYYKGSGTNAGYWEYATKADTTPGPVTATPTGVGISGSSNTANYADNADWNGQDGNVTTVGSNGGPSAYTTYDMSGNVEEWNDLTSTTLTARGVRGGNWESTDGSLSRVSRNVYEPATETSQLGFRLSGVPEIDGSGARLVLGLIVCGLALLEQRRQGR